MYTVAGEDEALSTAQALLQWEGRGHTFAIHAQEEGVIRRFAREIPVSRFLVNVPAALGGIGAESKLFPALTLGCGAVGGSSSSNNISPLDLVNIRRVAWGVESQSRKEPQADGALVELLTMKILERLG
jgi:acyl-CoA reductase-like NAD-dependent aldehyde dehydrogenase